MLDALSSFFFLIIDIVCVTSACITIYALFRALNSASVLTEEKWIRLAMWSLVVNTVADLIVYMERISS